MDVVCQARAQFGREPFCFNVNQKVFGSFAGVFHPDTFAVGRTDADIHVWC